MCPKNRDRISIALDVLQSKSHGSLAKDGFRRQKSTLRRGQKAVHFSSQSLAIRRAEESASRLSALSSNFYIAKSKPISSLEQKVSAETGWKLNIYLCMEHVIQFATRWTHFVTASFPRIYSGRRSEGIFL